MKINSYLLPWIIILAGVLYSLYLLTQIPAGVYFNGDGGLKAILAQQLSSGELRFDLAPPNLEWVRQLWREGLYPYEPPFVYYLADKYYITFPFTFSLVTAPFYAFFGERGLYVIPLLSVWAIWLLAYWACQRLKFKTWAISLALFFLVFASNLTIYSAMYWEHSLAVVLCFAGLIIWLIPQEKIRSRFNAVLSGVLVGLSAWVRSEFLAMVATLAVLVYLPLFLNLITVYCFQKKPSINTDNLGKDNKEIFILSMAGTVALFFACNQLIYGHFLGIHALQIVEGFSIGRRLSEAWVSFKEIFFTLFEYFPIAFFPLLYLALFFLHRLSKNLPIKPLISGIIVIFALLGIYLVMSRDISSLAAIKMAFKQSIIMIIILSLWLYFLRNTEVKLTLPMILVYLICFLFTAGVALLVDSGADEIAVGGKQWGNRYLLILLPWLAFVTVSQFNYLKATASFQARNVSIFMIALLTILGVYKNIYLGTKFFIKNHQGVAPAIEVLRNNTEPVVAVSYQYAAQLLEPPLRKEKIFFLADTSEDLLQLSDALLKQNQTRFTYVCYPYRPCQPPKDQAEHPEKLRLSKDSQIFQITLSELGTIGKYPIYQAQIRKLVP
jgi:hypothetical protein